MQPRSEGDEEGDEEEEDEDEEGEDEKGESEEEEEQEEDEEGEGDKDILHVGLSYRDDGMFFGHNFLLDMDSGFQITACEFQKPAPNTREIR